MNGVWRNHSQANEFTLSIDRDVTEGDVEDVGKVTGVDRADQNGRYGIKVTAGLAFDPSVVKKSIETAIGVVVKPPKEAAE